VRAFYATPSKNRVKLPRPVRACF